LPSSADSTEAGFCSSRKANLAILSAQSDFALTVPLIELLGNEKGVTVNELSEALDWLPHTVRAALTRLRADERKLIKLPPADGERYVRYRLENA